MQDRILADGALDGMNDEQRRLVYLIAETGLRLSEACNLTRERIVLDALVPHVQIREDGRRMKTLQSERDIPLVGVALLAMQAQPNGFPRYRDETRGALSGAANKFLNKHGLRPTPNHSIYSLRHTFEDRLTAVEAPGGRRAAWRGGSRRAGLGDAPPRRSGRRRRAAGLGAGHRRCGLPSPCRRSARS